MASSPLAGWLRLTLSPGIGTETQRKLLAAFGLPDAIFDAGRLAVESIVGNKADLLFNANNEADIEKALRWSEQPGCSILTLADADYPRALLEIPDPPTLLYVRGRLELLGGPGLAIVGSRNATPQGCQTAESFGRTLANGGLTIISGLALGIDAAAHRGAVTEVASTVAVIGTGADRIYPARNRDLALNIAENGVIVSEFPLGTPAAAANFPRRNRLISGLARGVLVVEAAPQSGSLITARLAGEQGREVFAVPGSIHSPLAKGCHQLIKQGAKLVETADDILEELGWQTVSEATAAATTSDLVLDAIGHEICDLDAIAVKTALPTDQLLARLLELELSGRLASLPGNRYQ
ncbi:MAG: DNA-processing protein DprA [Betaproteobacteria bacterium]